MKYYSFSHLIISSWPVQIQFDYNLPDEAKTNSPWKNKPHHLTLWVCVYKFQVHFPLRLWILQEWGSSIPFISMVEWLAVM